MFGLILVITEEVVREETMLYRSGYKRKEAVIRGDKMGEEERRGYYKRREAVKRGEKRL